MTETEMQFSNLHNQPLDSFFGLLGNMDGTAVLSTSPSKCSQHTLMLSLTLRFFLPGKIPSVIKHCGAHGDYSILIKRFAA